MYISFKYAGLALCFTVAALLSSLGCATEFLSNPSANHTHAGEGDEASHHAPVQNQQSEQAEQGIARHAHETEQASVSLSAEKLLLGKIKVAQLTPEIQISTLSAPGEIKANGYQSYVVSPRTESVVISRHAILGEHVLQGQKLVTLFSEAMAQAQADYLIAATDWQRVKTLTAQSVSESARLKAEISFNAAYGKLIALGLTEQAIKDIAKKDTALFGQYSLVAQRSGVVLQDDFLQGQRIDAGDTIMLLADEKNLWVEAKFAANKQLNLSTDTPANVIFNKQSYHAKVIQAAHTIDPITRTRIIRLSVDNVDDNLHSGMFVTVNFQFASNNKVMAVPEEALTRGIDGDWTVFVAEHDNEFKAVEVELGRKFGDLREIIGLETGTSIVTQGAFFVAGELAKGGFDPHNH